MPIYEYKCLKCGAQFEKLQKFSDLPLANCIRCGGKVERLISSSAIQFKGSGWYVTDYPRKSSPAESEKTDGSSAGETKKTSDPSPAAKSQDPKPSSKNKK